MKELELRTSFEPVMLYKCVHCGNMYESIPDECTCVKRLGNISYVPGMRVGPFIVKERKGGGILLIFCILCGCHSDMNCANIKRQQSCGCKPRRIEILQVTPESVMYKCKRCHKTSIVVPPIVSYCCSDAESIEELGD